MLGGQSDLAIVGDAANGRDCLAVLPTVEPDLILMDLRMPVLDGIEATRRVVAGRDGPWPRVIALTTFDVDEMALDALSAGADGFLLKDTPPEVLVSAVRGARDGETTLSPTAVRALLGHVRSDEKRDRRSRARQQLGALSDRERDVAVAVGNGRNNAEIADSLHLSVPTIKTYVSRLLDRLDVTNRVQIAICVHQAGLDEMS